MKFERGSVVNEWDIFESLFHEFWLEASLFEPLPPMHLDKQRYFNMERVGAYQLFWIKNDDDEPVGLSGIFTQRSLHTEERIARDDIFFLRKTERRGLLVVRFMKWIEEKLMNEHAINAVHFHLRIYPERTGTLLKYSNYDKLGDIYRKALQG